MIDVEVLEVLDAFAADAVERRVAAGVIGFRTESDEDFIFNRVGTILGLLAQRHNPAEPEKDDHREGLQPHRERVYLSRGTVPGRQTTSNSVAL